MGCRGGESGAVHAVGRAHVSTARACKSGLAGWDPGLGLLPLREIHLMSRRVVRGMRGRDSGYGGDRGM